MSESYGILLVVHSLLVRQCLQVLTDQEIEDLLSSSERLRNAVRSAANKPKSVRVDSRVFRRWLAIPSLSDELLQKMPLWYAKEIHLREEKGESIVRSPGVRALLLLGTEEVTAEEFARRLEQFRSDGQANSRDDPAEASAENHGIASRYADESLSSSEIAEMVARLREQSDVLAQTLRSTSESVLAGRIANPVDDQIARWNQNVEEAWLALGSSEPASDCSFEAMEARRRDVEEREKAAADLEAAREEKLATLTRLRNTAESLEPMIETSDTFSKAYEEACAQIAVLEQELEVLASGVPTGRVVDEGYPSNSSISEDTSDGLAPQQSDEPEGESTETQADVVSVPADTSETDAHVTSLGARDDSDDVVADSKRREDAEADLQPTEETEEPEFGGEATEPVESPEMLTRQVGEEDLESLPDATTAAVESGSARPESSGPEELSRGQPNGYHYAEIATHIRDGRFGAAWYVARAAGLGEFEATAYRLAAAAFNSVPGGIDPAEVLINLTTMMSDGGDFSYEEARVVLAATLRATLAAGWSPRSELEAIASQANLDAASRDLVDAVIAAADRNYQHLHDFGGQFEISLEEVHDFARKSRDELAALRIKFARADKVLKYLLRTTEPLGAAFEAVLADTSGDTRRESLTAALALLEAPDDLIEAADSVVSTPQQRRKPIESHARVRLRKAIEITAECVTRALNVAVAEAGDARAAVAQEVKHQLVSVARAAHFDINALAPGEVAMARLVEWIISPATPSRGLVEETQVLLEEALPIVSARRDDAGLPIVGPDNARKVIDELRSPLTPSELFEIYIARGDLQQAGAVAEGDIDLQDRLQAERSAWSRRLAREVRAVRAELARTYADDVTQQEQSDAEAKLVGPTDYTGDRFDLQMAELDELRAVFADHRSRSAALLRKRVEEEIGNAGDRHRVLRLIEQEDFVGANELLALARSGPLPVLDANDPTGACVFEAFKDALSRLDLARETSIHDLVAIFAEGEVDDVTAHGDLERLRNWDNLMQRRGQSYRRQGTLAAILRALGLDMRGEPNRQTPPGIRHFDLYRINARPVDGSLVPGLGSQATHYMVSTTADHKLLRETLSSAFPTKTGPNIVLFDGVLTLDQRRQCLNVCREKKISAIVVDHAVAAFVAARYPRSFRAVQQITLPFTCFTHYTVVAGNVPDEVFVGRNDELAQLTDRTGSLFVYGGRQLGKSALLRKIQRDFNNESDHHAIFIDLNSHGIGTWADPQQLWHVLYNELAKVPAMGIKPNMAVRNHEPVIRAIRQWLEAKDSRRLLLLLDEADAFLEKESSDPGGRFKNVGPLKGLFDDTEGRFKPIFAGLHKVQRLQNVANTPLAHGGRDVLIGPLAAQPARDLVVRPMEALGYRFENPEAVWRLLAFTNLQPGLIQVVCNDLIAHLQARPLHKDEPLISIRDEDIDAVTGNERTRDKIAEKLRLTIALEDRYRVIALAVAIMSMADGFREKYAATDIRDHCELYWQQGFEGLSTAEFAVYLDELVGLGVLIKDRDNQFSVRSPNIVTMLGTKQQLEAELDENKEQFELPHEYNPRSTRRQVSLYGRLVRSPLSEHDLSALIPVRKSFEPTDFVIVGSEALGIEHVASVLAAVGEERGVSVTVLDARSDGFETRLSEYRWAARGLGGPRALVVDVSKATAESATEVVGQLRSLSTRGHGHLVVIFGAAGVAAAQHLIEGTHDRRIQVIALEKWSGDGIRSWHDIPFNTPTDRQELLEHSGGWPELVERAVADVSIHGTSYAEVWERLSEFPDDAAAADEFLQRVGVEGQLRELLSRWADLGSKTYESIADIAAVLECDVSFLGSLAADLATLGVLNEHHGEYAIDAVVARALERIA